MKDETYTRIDNYSSNNHEIAPTLFSKRQWYLHRLVPHCLFFNSAELGGSFLQNLIE